MPWTTPPTFTAGAILTAAQCNILSDDVEYLHGLLTGVNLPFRSVGFGDDVAAGAVNWRIRHLGRYLHYKIVLEGGEHDELKIYYDNVVVFEDLGHKTAPYTWEGSLDLHDTGIIASTPTIGDFYLMTYEFTKQPATSTGGLVHYLLESDSDTL